MAADILLYDTDVVPVGEDQKQHVELARDTAQRFNHIYGDTFKLPEPVIAGSGARIMGLDDPTRKMSGSESGAGHSINVLDTPDDIRSRIMKATTDSLREIRFDDVADLIEFASVDANDGQIDHSAKGQKTRRMRSRVGRLASA